MLAGPHRRSSPDARRATGSCHARQRAAGGRALLRSERGAERGSRPAPRRLRACHPRRDRIPARSNRWRTNCRLPGCICRLPCCLRSPWFPPMIRRCSIPRSPSGRSIREPRPKRGSGNSAGRLWKTPRVDIAAWCPRPTAGNCRTGCHPRPGRAQVLVDCLRRRRHSGGARMTAGCTGVKQSSTRIALRRCWPRTGCRSVRDFHRYRFRLPGLQEAGPTPAAPGAARTNCSNTWSRTLPAGKHGARRSNRSGFPARRRQGSHHHIIRTPARCRERLGRHARSARQTACGYDMRLGAEVPAGGR